MELKWLKDYVALLEQGSFSKAAESRFVTQPAFSRRIRSLENWLGVSLVDRNQYPTTFTPAGEAFAEQARQLIGQTYAVRNQMRDISAAREQLLIMSQHALAVSFFPSWMQTLEALADGALIKVETGNLHDNVEAFLSGNGDFLLCYSSTDIFCQLQRDDVESLQVGVDELVPVTAVDATGKALFALEEGKPLKLLSHPAESFFGRLLQRECLSRLPADLSINLACENGLSEALKALVLKGYGMAWLPRSLISSELASGQLQRLEEPLHTVDLSIKLFRLRQSRSAAAEQFWQYLQELYKQTSGGD
ncbi:LysR substrate-binding domain-containing protein [Neptunomonas japonica]|uniref:LysR family transcriptional regulator n=1 Tax=Neptunomonas japonica JAMM 1380 TaxID=1441457 RepID=A0A7R6PG27_9GAMM|nr:LysR substrate-binding domain-containing protein [Neptunomonas japonica]BBB29512.1 LysR family transcriptional regulator [Neptunomonas japonica JAMM 1380]